MPLLTWFQKLLGKPGRFEKGGSRRPARRRRREELVQLYLTRLEDRRVLNADFSFDAVSGTLTLDNFSETTAEDLTVRDAGANYEFTLSEGVWSESAGGSDPGVSGAASDTISILKSLVNNVDVEDNAALAADPGVTFETFTGLGGTFTLGGVGHVAQAAGSQVTLSTLDVTEAASVSLAEAQNDFDTVSLTSVTDVIAAGDPSVRLADADDLELEGGAGASVFGTLEASFSAGGGSHTLTVGSALEAGSFELIGTGADDTVNLNADLTATAGPGTTLRVTDAGQVNVAAGVTLSTAAANTDMVFTTDDISIDATASLDAGTGTVSIENASADREIDLGTDTAGKLGLTSTELDTITAGSLVIGRNDATAAGALTVSDAINLTAIDNLHLRTGSTVTGTDVTGGTLTVANLEVDAGGDVILSNATLAHNVDALAIRTSSGQIEYRDADDLVLDALTGPAALTAPGNMLVEAIGDLTVQGNITKSAGGDAELRLLATGTIVAQSAAAVTSTSNRLNTILNSDSDGNGDGAILLDSGTTITTNGGDITLGGGLDPLTTAAQGTATHLQGVELQAAQLLAGAGSVGIRGAGDDADGGFGILIDSGSSISGGAITLDGLGGNGSGGANFGIVIDLGSTISGAAAIDLTGIGGNGGGGANFGILIDTTSSISGAGAINLTGTGGNGDGGANFGIALSLASSITSTGSGLISLSGTGGNGEGGANFGIVLDLATLIEAQADGGISLQGTAGDGDGGANFGVTLSGATITAAGAGDISIQGDGGRSDTGPLDGGANFGINLDTTSSIVATGSGSINLTGNGGTGAGGANFGVGIFDASTIAAQGTGDVDLTGHGGSKGTDNDGILLESGTVTSASGAISLNGTAGDDGLGGASGQGIFSSGTIGSASTSGLITLTADTLELAPGAVVQGAGDLVLQPEDAATDIGLGAAAGTFQLTSAEIAALQDGFNSITIGRADGTGKIIVDGVAFLDTVTLRNPGALSQGIEVAGTLDGSGDVSLISGGPIDVNAALSATGEARLQTPQTVTVVAQVTTGTGLVVETDAADSSITGQMSGAGGLTIASAAGTGVVTVSNTSNDYAGPTSVDGGTLALGDSEVLPDATAVTVAAGAVVDLADHNETIGSLAGASTATVDLGSATLTTGGDGTSTDFAGDITGTGSLVKKGAGTFTISGATTYTGATDVNDGTLLVDGTTVAENTFTVNNGGTLGGNGTIAGPVNVLAGGKLAPGSSPGILNTGDLGLVTGTTFSVEINGANPLTPDFDQVIVTGAVDLGDATLDLILDPGLGALLSGGEQFRIISNDLNDQIQGEFAGLAEGDEITADFGGSGKAAYITYKGGDGNDVVVFVAGTLVAGSQGVTILRRNGASIDVLAGATEATVAIIASVPIASLFADGIQINGRDGADDLLIVDYTVAGLVGGEFNVPVSFNGGNGPDVDTLIVRDGSFAELAYHITGDGAGNLVFTDDDVLSTHFEAISFTGLEPVTVTSLLGVVTVDIDDGVAGGSLATTISDDGSGNLLIDADGALEDLIVTVPALELRINGDNDADDVITIASLPAGFAAAITIDGRGNATAAGDTINIDTDLALTSATAALTLTAETVNLNGGPLGTIETTAGIDVNATVANLGAAAGAVPLALKTDGGNVDFDGTTTVVLRQAVSIDTEQNAAGNAGDALLTNASVTANAGNRNLLIDTTNASAAAGDAAGNVNLGVFNDADTGGAAFQLVNNVTIHSTAVLDADDRDLTVDDAIALDGNFSFDGRNVTIAGSITLNTTSSVALTASRSIRMLAGSQIETADGDITLLANQAGTTAGSFTGIQLSSAEIASVNGHILLDGTGGTVAGGNIGVLLHEAALIRATGTQTGIDAPSISINGHGGGDATATGPDNHGIFITGGAVVESTGTAAISLDGTGGSADDESAGIRLEGLGTRITAQGDGAILLIGQGGSGPGDAYDGIQVFDQALIDSTGSTTATIRLEGTGGSSALSDDNLGIALESAGRIESIDGDIELNGIGGFGAGGNHVGIGLEGGSVIRSTGAAGILLEGTGGSLDGLGAGGTAGGNTGIVVADGALIDSAGTGFIELAGTAGSDASDGIVLDGSTIVIQSISGDIGVDATGRLVMSGDSLVQSHSGDIGLRSTADVLLAFVNADADAAGAAGTIGIQADSDSVGGGAIRDNRSLETLAPNLTGAAALLLAGTGIGSDAAANEDLDLAVTDVAARTASGDIHLQNTGALAITTVTLSLQLSDVNPLQFTDSGATIQTGAAGDNITIRAASPLDVLADVLNNGGGNITLAAEGALATDILTTDADITASGGDGNISLFAGGDLAFNSGTVSAAGTGAILLSAGEDFNGGANQNGLAAADLTMADGTLIVGETGDITLRAPGDVQLGRVVTAGDVFVTADFDGVGGGLTDNDGAISENLTDGAGREGAENIVADRVELRAATGLGTGAGNLDELADIDLDAATLFALNSISGHVQIFATGDLALDQVSNATRRVAIDAGGAISDADAANDVVANVTAAEVVLRAGAGIGAGPAGAGTDLNTAVTTASLETAAGDINVRNAGGLTLDSLGGLAHGAIITNADGTATGNDRLTVVAASPLTVNAAVINNDGGNIVLTAAGATAADDLTLNANVTAAGGNGSISLTAGDEILHNTGTVSAAGTGDVSLFGQRIAMAANTTIAATQGNVTLDANTGTFSMASGAQVTTAGNVFIAADTLIFDTSATPSKIQATGAASEVVLAPETGNRDIDLGGISAADLTFELNAAELNTIEAPRVRIGVGAAGGPYTAATAGDITFVGAFTADAAFATAFFALRTTGTVTGTAATVDLASNDGTLGNGNDNVNRGFVVRSGGPIDFGTVAHNFNTIAATTGPTNSPVTFRDGLDAMSVGTVDGLAGITTGNATVLLQTASAAAGDLTVQSPITTNGGLVDLEVGRDAVLQAAITTLGGDVDILAGRDITSNAAGTITTTAALNSGIPSGDVSLQAAKALTLAGKITVRGANNNAGAGSDGGDVALAALGATLEVRDIDASGGNGTGAAGGASGDISLFTSAAGSNIRLTGELRALGGTGAPAGAGGAVLVNSAGAIVDADDVSIDILAETAELIAVTGIAGNTSLAPANAVLEIDVTTLAAATASGDIVVTDVAGGLRIGILGGTTGVQITGPGGSAADDIAITALSPLTVDAIVANLVGGNISLTATDDALAPEPDNLTLNANVTASGGDGNITLSGENLQLAAGVVVSAAGAGTITGNVSSTTTLADNSKLLTAGGAITLNTNDLVLSTTAGAEAAINAGAGIVTIRNSSLNRLIDLGTNTAGQLGLTDAELDQVTAGVLRIGRNDALASGAINLSAAIDLAGTTVLHLLTGSTISGAGTIVEDRLAIEAGGNVTLANANDVNFVAIHALAGASNISFRDIDGFTVDSVDGVDGVRAAGSVTLTSDAGDVTINNVTGNDLQAGSTIAVTLDGADALLTFASGANSQGLAGSHTYTADRFDLAGTATITATNQSVLIQNRSAGRLIDLGSAGDTSGINTLALSDSELDRVLVGPNGVVRVGRNDGSASGAITLSAAINTNLAGSTNILHLISGAGVTGTVATGGSIIEQQLAIEAGAGVTLDNPANDVDKLAIRVLTAGAGDIRYVDADGFAVSTVDGMAGVTTNAGLIDFNALAGGAVADGAVIIENTALAADVAATGTITIRLHRDEALFTVAAGANVTSIGGLHTYTADNMNLAGTITATGQTVILQPEKSGDAINLGAAGDGGSNTLELSDAELDNITAARLVIGRNDLGNAAGRISVSNISLDAAKVITLNLLTGADVVESGADAAADISVTNLAILSVTGVNIDVDVTGNLAVRNATGGGVNITDTAGGLTVDAVAVLPTGGPDSVLDEVTTVGGGITLVAQSPLTISGLVSDTGGGDITLTAVDDLVAPEPDNLTINNNVTATGGDGNIVLSGENVLINANATVSVVGGGSVHSTASKLTALGPNALIQTAGGNVVITSDDLVIDTSASPATIDVGGGLVRLRTSSDGRTIGLGGGAGDFNLSDAEVDRVFAATLEIGRRDFDGASFNASGTITIDELTFTGLGGSPSTLVLLTGADVREEAAGDQPADVVVERLGIRARQGIDLDVDVNEIAAENQVITTDPSLHGEILSGAIDITDTDGAVLFPGPFVIDSGLARNDGLTVSVVQVSNGGGGPGPIADAGVIEGIRNDAFQQSITVLAADDDGLTGNLRILRPIISNGGDVDLDAHNDVISVVGLPPGGGGSPFAGLLTNGPGDGSVTVAVDEFGSFGSNIFPPPAPFPSAADNALFDKPGPGGIIGTAFLSGLAVGFGGPERSFLTSGTFDVSPVGGSVVSVLNGTTIEVQSSFLLSGAGGELLFFELVQTLSSQFDAGQQVGSVLTQTYTITNLGGLSVDFDVLRYFDGDVGPVDATGVTSSGDVNNDGGGRIVVNGTEIMFVSEDSDGTASGTLVGISAEGGVTPATNRFELDDIPPVPEKLRTRIGEGEGLDDTILGDNNGNGIVDGDFDVEVALRNEFSLTVGGQAVYTTQTFFGTVVVNQSQDAGTIRTTVNADKLFGIAGPIDISSGDVTIDAGVDSFGVLPFNAGNVNLEADVITRGADASAFQAFQLAGPANGGQVDINQNPLGGDGGNGTVDLTVIDASGGNGDGLFVFAGGNAGDINATNFGPNDITLHGQLKALGGSGSPDGSDGTVRLTATGGAIVDADDSSTDIVAGQARLIAFTRVGDSSVPLAVNEVLEVEIATLAGLTNGGDFNVSDLSGGLSVGAVDGLLGITVDGRTFAGVIGDNPGLNDPSLDVDLYRIDLLPNERIQIDLDAEIFGSFLDTLVQVFDVNGNLLATNDDAAAPGELPTLDSFLEFIAPAAGGTFFIGVSQVLNGNYDVDIPGSGTSAFLLAGNGLYTISVDFPDSNQEARLLFPPFNPLVESNDTRFTAIPLIVSDRAALTSGAILVTTTGSLGVDQAVNNFSGGGAALEAGADLILNNPISAGGPAVVSLTAGASAQGGGRILDGDELPVGEIGDNPALFFNVALDVDVVEVTLASGEQLSVDVDAAEFGSPLNSRIRIFDSLGNELLANDDGAAPGEFLGTDSFLTFTAPQAGKFYVGISSTGRSYDPNVLGSGVAGSTTGLYTLRMAVNGTPLTGELRFDFNDTIATAVRTGAAAVSPTDRFAPLNVAALGLVARAASGIGQDFNSIETSVVALEGAGGTGGVFVNNMGGLFIGGLDTLSDPDVNLGPAPNLPEVGLSATGGDIRIRATSALSVTEDVVNRHGGEIQLVAGQTFVVPGFASIINGAQLVSQTGIVNRVPPDVPINSISTPQITSSGDATLTMNIGVAGEENFTVVVDWGDGTIDTFGRKLDGTGDQIDPGTFVARHTYTISPNQDPALGIPFRVEVRNDPLINFFADNNILFGDDGFQFFIPAFNAELEKALPPGEFNFRTLSVATRDLNFPVPGEGLGAIVFDLSTGGTTGFIREQESPPIFESTQFNIFIQQQDFSAGAAEQQVVDEREVVLEVLQADGTTLTTVTFRGEEADDFLNQLPEYLKKLPDGRYRIMLKEAGEERLRVIRDLLLRNHVPVDIKLPEQSAAEGQAWHNPETPAEATAAADGRDAAWENWAGGRRRLAVEPWTTSRAADVPHDEPVEATPPVRLESRRDGTPAGDGRPVPTIPQPGDDAAESASAEASELPASVLASAALVGASLVRRPLRTATPDGVDRTMADIGRRARRALRKFRAHDKN